MRSYLRRIDTRTSGDRYDVTPLFADPAAFAIARHLGVGVIPLRKGGKLPGAADRERFVDYSGEEKHLEIRPDAVGERQAILLVDIETGAQTSAAIALLERRGGGVVGIATLHMDRNPATEAIRAKYAVRTASDRSAS